MKSAASPIAATPSGCLIREKGSFCNLAGVIPGSNPHLAPLLVGAHYDSVIAAPCADDNAAAVAIAFSAAESELERT
jgi:Zn-dependent M28 family amino/carboxypeptidase